MVSQGRKKDAVGVETEACAERQINIKIDLVVCVLCGYL